jgi:TnpA family transposase
VTRRRSAHHRSHAASDLLRVTQSGGTASIRGRAIAEYGRIAKTLHLLDFIDQDDVYRSEVHQLLAMQESSHALARGIFHGHSGEILEPYRTGQVEQLGALGLVLNAIILWNTRYLDHAIASLTADGVQIEPADISRLSPFQSRHISLVGRYNFAHTVLAGLRTMRRRPPAATSLNAKFCTDPARPPSP